MNPQLHAEFVELCALFYTGELSDEEWALLQIHMAYCDDCRQSFEQYKHVAKELIPSLAAAAAKDAYGPYESDASLAHAEQQLMDRVKQRSAPPEAAPAQATRRKWPRVLVPSAISALAAGVAVAILYHAWDVHKSVLERQTPALAAVSAPALRPSSGTKASPANSHLEIDALRRQLADASGHSESAAAALHALQVKLTEEEAQRSSLQAERDSLGTQLSSAQSDIQRLRQEVDTLHGDSKRRVDYVAELEGKVRTLNVALEESQTALDDKERMLALDKDFLAHDRDIRDLIGARNLYIADIFDTTESGKTAKPFGRIFYTQDRSLVFYGFDLEKKAGAKHAVAYQAWGSGTDRAPVSLGIFYQDDGHKRWVLRCNDARTLSRLNMVFVTVEPEGGSRTPTGQQFLRAYLQIQPNHP